VEATRRRPLLECGPDETAVPRLRQVPKAEATSPLVTSMYDFLFDGRDPVSEPGTWTGSSGDWWTVFALVPDVFEHAVQGFALYQSPKRTLDPVLRELAQLRAGWAAGSQFVFSQHCKSLRDLGVEEAKIQSVPSWSVATCYDDAERLVLAYADCLVYEHGRVPDDLFDSLRVRIGDEAVLELTYITCLYFQHSVMSRALRTEFDDRAEPVVEVTRPEGASALHPGRSPGPPPEAP
jgi:alkylhydroperoxidase family enzyme